MLWRLLTWPFRLPGRILKSFHGARTLKLTREGKYFVGITIGIGLAAINTGNNLLYLLLGWLLSVIIASGILSDICLRAVRITRQAPRRIYASRPFLMELQAQNCKKRLASYSLEVEDICEGHPIDKRCYFLKIPEGKTQHTAYRHTISRRGLYRFQGFRVSTKFPFGLFRKSTSYNNPSEILVFPSTHPVSLPPPRGQLLGDQQSNVVGRRGEFFGLREYRDGDDRRSIHWRSTAREGKLLVREYEDESQRRMTLLIDNALPETRGEKDEQALEDAISFCASLASAYLDKGYALRLVGRDLLVPFASGDTQLQRVLKALALLETKNENDAFSADIAPRTKSVLVVPKGISARSRPAQASHVLEVPR
ncbi:MAG: DUF58 domain-containing protein [Myxococcales bacterium]|nr:DUF58 domain-containing protein [Myxococcales bacterium]